MRAFLGIPLPQEFRAAFVSARAALAGADGAWRDQKWVAEENLHITLKFLGDVSDEAATGLAGQLARAVVGSDTIPLRFTAIQGIPTLRRARMLWAEFTDDTEELTSLARIVDRLATQIGVEPDTRPYTPHATIVRARAPQAIGEKVLLAANAEIRSVLGKEPVMSVRQAILYESTLKRSGPIYREHAVIDIGPAD